MAKKHKSKLFLAELRKIPIVQVACEKTGISRQSIYRWRKQDEKFLKAMDEAIAEGEELVSDMSESQLLTLIKEKNFSAIRFWLNKRSPKYKDTVEVTAKVTKDEALTAEDEEVVNKIVAMSPLNQTDHES